MKSQMVCVLLVSFLLTCGMLGCGEKPQPLAEAPSEVVDEPTGSIVEKPEPAVEQRKPGAEDPKAVVSKPDVMEEIKARNARLGEPTPSTLMRPPTKDEWPKGVKHRVDNAFNTYRTDPISACFMLSDILLKQTARETAPQKKDAKPETPLTRAHMTWLAESAAKLRPAAAQVLVKDFRAAQAGSDARGALLAFLALRKLDAMSSEIRDTAVNGQVPSTLTQLKNIVQSKEFPDVCALLAKTMKTGTSPPDVWTVKPVRVTRSRGEFEAHCFGARVTLKPNHGCEIVRIEARAANISPASDPPYAVWSLTDASNGLTAPDPKKADWWLYLGDEKKEEQEKAMAENRPVRLLTYNMIYLMGDDGAAYPCQHVAEGCSVLEGEYSLAWKAIIMLQKDRPEIRNLSPFWMGSFVRQGTVVDIDVIFQTPIDQQNLRLVVLGSDPVPLPLEDT